MTDDNSDLGRVKLNDDGSKTISLVEPIESDKGPITELRIKKPRARDLEAMDEGRGDVKKTMLLLAQLSGHTLGTIRKLGSVDFATVADAAGDYLGKVL